jgi:hypothetical protein
VSAGWQVTDVVIAVEVSTNKGVGGKFQRFDSFSRTFGLRRVCCEIQLVSRLMLMTIENNGSELELDELDGGAMTSKYIVRREIKIENDLEGKRRRYATKNVETHGQLRGFRQPVDLRRQNRKEQFKPRKSEKDPVSFGATS